MKRENLCPLGVKIINIGTLSGDFLKFKVKSDDSRLKNSPKFFFFNLKDHTFELLFWDHNKAFVFENLGSNKDAMDRPTKPNQSWLKLRICDCCVLNPHKPCHQLKI